MLPTRQAFITTALVAAVRDETQGKNARPCAAWVGVAPRRLVTWATRACWGATSAGAPSLRPLLGHGVRSGRGGWIGHGRGWTGGVDIVQPWLLPI